MTREREQTRVVAVFQEKGGVGKTTTALCLARAASTLRLRVLLIDFDPQGDLTDTLGGEEDIQAGLADVLFPKSEVAAVDVLLSTAWDGVDLIPAGERLDYVEQQLLGLGGEHRLRTVLTDELLTGYDLVLVDTRPSTGRLTLNALVAADVAVIVTNPHRYAAKALTPALETIALVQEHANPDLKLGGIVLNNLARKETLVSKNYSAEIREAGLDLLEPEVPFATAIATVSATGQGLDQLGEKDLHRIYETHLRRLLDGVLEEVPA